MGASLLGARVVLKHADDSDSLSCLIKTGMQKLACTLAHTCSHTHTVHPVQRCVAQRHFFNSQCIFKAHAQHQHTHTLTELTFTHQLLHSQDMTKVHTHTHVQNSQWRRTHTAAHLQTQSNVLYSVALITVKMSVILTVSRAWHTRLNVSELHIKTSCFPASPDISYSPQRSNQFDIQRFIASDEARWAAQKAHFTLLCF